MTKFDKKIKKLSKEFIVPQEYHQKVDEVLESIQEESMSSHTKRPSMRLAGSAVVVFLFIMGCMLFSNSKEVKADFFRGFMQTIMDFFGIEEEASQNIGITSNKDDYAAKQDLMIELLEEVIDSRNIYLVIKITASPEIRFEEQIGFDYFGFCRGSNYNSSDLLPGATDCKLLEVLEKKENVAAYVVSISTNEELKEGEEVSAFFKDLTLDPYGENPQTLVEGIWSVPFTISYTVSEEVSRKGTEEMVYPFLGMTAAVKELKLTPLGLSVISDVSNVPYEELCVADGTIAIRLKMIDGGELTVVSHDAGESTISNTVSNYIFQESGKTYIERTCQFDKPVDAGQVLGIYVEDCYVPIKEYD